MRQQFKTPQRSWQMDPAAARWLNYVEETSNSEPKRENFYHGRSSAPIDSRNPAHRMIGGRWRQVPASFARPETFDRLPQSTDEEISKKLEAMPDPPLCFCNKPASKMYTPEFGTIYECYTMNAQNRNKSTATYNELTSSTRITRVPTHICGFHIHQRAWDQFRRSLQFGSDVDPCHAELDICPAFNYTFCVIFRVNNEFPKRSPPVPRCFCNIPVIIRNVEGKRNVRMSFTCKNFDVEGAKPKCSWVLWAEEVPFIKPRYPLHAIGRTTETNDLDEPPDSESDKQIEKQLAPLDKNEEEDQEKNTAVAPSASHSEEKQREVVSSEEEEEEGLPPLPQQQQQQSMSVGGGPSCSDKAKNEMLQLLLNVKVPVIDHFNSNVPTEDAMNTATTTRMKDEYTGPKDLTPSSSISEVGSQGSDSSCSTFCSVPTHPATSSLNGAEKYMEANATVEEEQQQPDQVSVPAPAPALEPVCKAGWADEKVLEELSNRLSDVEMEKEAHLEEIRKLKEAVESNASAIRRLYKEQGGFQVAMEGLYRVIDEETATRRSNQKRTVELEVSLNELLIESELLQEKNETYKEKMMARDMKCRVCFHNNIDTAVIPCFHCGKFSVVDFFYPFFLGLTVDFLSF
ncbi:hypothetical protein DFQ30_009309 [Apophysomyces sp. BC1015]|nr:hypothetical protein DFQ30_009309 [Apophysomyces sp. BC1015]